MQRVNRKGKTLTGTFKTNKICVEKTALQLLSSSVHVSLESSFRKALQFVWIFVSIARMSCLPVIIITTPHAIRFVVSLRFKCLLWENWENRNRHSPLESYTKVGVDDIEWGGRGEWWWYWEWHWDSCLTLLPLCQKCQWKRESASPSSGTYFSKEKMENRIPSRWIPFLPLTLPSVPSEIERRRGFILSVWEFSCDGIYHHHPSLFDRLPEERRPKFQP